MFKFSKAGVKNPDIFERIYKDFIDWCREQLPSGTFSTYCDGEPVCFCNGAEIPYSAFLKRK